MVFPFIVVALVAANSVVANISGPTEGNGLDNKNEPLKDAFPYMAMTISKKLWEDPRKQLIYNWLESLNIPRNADAETILTILEETGNGAWFVELTNRQAELDCHRIKQHSYFITEAYVLSRRETWSIEPFLLHYGSLAYGYCASQINQEIIAHAKPLPGEHKLDRIVAFGTEPELELEQCKVLSQDELLKRAKQVHLASHETKVHRMLEAAKKLRNIPSKPSDPNAEASNLYSFISSFCGKLYKSFADELGVISMAYAFRGVRLDELEPRLQKLHEYRRICNAVRYNHIRKVKETFKKLFRDKKVYR